MIIGECGGVPVDDLVLRTRGEPPVLLSAFFEGIPSPGGSKSAFPIKRPGGKWGAVVVDAGGAKTKEWRKAVAVQAKAAWGQRPLITEAIVVYFQFTMPRPQYHFGKRDGMPYLKADSPKWHIIKPDTTKLTRSTEDALTGVLWIDDAQIVKQICSKRYGQTPGARIIIEKAL